MWRPSLSGAIVVYGVVVTALPLMYAVLNGIGIGAAGGWAVPLSLGITLMLASLALFKEHTTIEFPRNILVLAGLPLFLSACVSIMGRQSFSTMMFGVSLELGTLGSLAIFAISILFGASLSSRQALRMLDIFMISVVIGGAVTLWHVFTSGWGDVAQMRTASLIILGALIVSAICTDTAVGRARFMYGVSTVFLGALSVLSFDASGGIIAAIILLLVFGFALSFGRSRYVSWVTALVACAIGVSLLAGMEGKYVPASPDVRPALPVTASIIGAQYFQDARSALLGSGPNTFNRAWERHRIAELNTSQYWEFTPQGGYSTAMTLAVTLGAFGFISFLYLGIALAVFMTSRIADTRGADDIETWLRALPAAVLAFFAMGVAFTDAIEMPLFLAGGMAIGMVARTLERDGNVVSFDFSFGGSRIAASAIAVVLLIVAVWLLQISLRPVFAERFHAQAVALDSTEDPRASRLFERASRIWGVSPYAFDAARAFEASASSAGAKGDTYGLRVSTEKALSYAGRAIDLDPGNYQVWLYRGSLLTALISSEYPNAAVDAYADLQRAKMLAPMRPDILYQEAVLHVISGRKVDARIALEKALELKPDYAEALSLLESLSE